MRLLPRIESTAAATSVPVTANPPERADPHPNVSLELTDEDLLLDFFEEDLDEDFEEDFDDEELELLLFDEEELELLLEDSSSGSVGVSGSGTIDSSTPNSTTTEEDSPIKTLVEKDFLSFTNTALPLTVTLLMK